MADSLCTFLTVDRSGPEQQEPPPRLPLPPLPLLHESQHGYADPDRPLPRVLHTDEIRGWHWGLTLRHPAWLVLLAEVTAESGPDPTLQDVVQRAHDQGVLALVDYVAFHVDQCSDREEYLRFFEHWVDEPRDWFRSLRAPVINWSAMDPDIVSTDPLPWFCTVFTTATREALEGTDVVQLTRLYETAVQELDEVTYGAVLRRVAHIGTEPDIDALQNIASTEYDDLYEPWFANAKRLIRKRRWGLVRRQLVVARGVALYWGALAARPDAHGRAPPGAVSAFVADGW